MELHYAEKIGLKSHRGIDKNYTATLCVIITATPKLLWYNFWINRYRLAIFVHKR